MIYNTNQKNIYGFNQKPAVPNNKVAVLFGRKVPLTSEQLVKKAEKAFEHGDTFISLHIYDKAKKLAEKEVTEGKLPKEKFVDMLVNLSNKFMDASFNTFNTAQETAYKALEKSKGNKNSVAKTAKHVKELQSEVIATQAGINNMATNIITQYENQNAVKLKHAAQKLQEEQILIELAELKKVKEHTNHQVPIGFVKEKTTPVENTAKKINIQDAALEVEEIQTEMALEAAKEIKAQNAKKQPIGFKFNPNANK